MNSPMKIGLNDVVYNHHYFPVNFSMPGIHFATSKRFFAFLVVFLAIILFIKMSYKFFRLFKILNESNFTKTR